MATRLQAVQARLTATMEALFDFLFVIDREDRILDFHSPIPERLYIPPEQFLNRRYQDILPPEASAVIAAAIEQARAQGSSRGFVYSLPYPDGQHYFELSIAPVGDPASPEGSILFIAREITAQKQAEAALQESEARFAQCARESRTYIWEVDADGLYTYLSPAVEDVLGYRPEELVGHQHFYDLHPEADRNALREAAFEIFQQRGLFRHFQSRALAKNGQEV
ncbi:MAG: PAS domain-containing protein, partial [Akkermansiaceae bacterium]|nr:PAS domain-containing protein [Akkermansiaceae bacterium]